MSPDDFEICLNKVMFIVGKLLTQITCNVLCCIFYDYENVRLNEVLTKNCAMT